MKYVLDSRFLVEHFLSSDPKVKLKTQALLRRMGTRDKGFIPTMTLAEVTNVVCQATGKRRAEEMVEFIKCSDLTLSYMTPSVAARAGFIKCDHRKISMADCVIAATALHIGARVVSDDPHFEKIHGLKVQWI